MTQSFYMNAIKGATRAPEVLDKRLDGPI